MVHGISFSASYQLVSRFAGKNTISLGLGCVGSGGIVLLLELGLGINAHPSRPQNMVLYLICAGAWGWSGVGSAREVMSAERTCVVQGRGEHRFARIISYWAASLWHP